METIKELIERFQLKPHPEGGYFTETYRSTGLIEECNLGANFKGSRNYSTCIYFLLLSDNFSAFHKINQDEIWHFYKGACIDLHIISPSGQYSKIKIGSDIPNGEVPQYVVPAGHYFAAEVVTSSSYAFVGCTVSPGFDFRDFDLSERTYLLKKFPKHSEIISRLTR